MKNYQLSTWPLFHWDTKQNYKVKLKRCVLINSLTCRKWLVHLKICWNTYIHFFFFILMSPVARRWVEKWCVFNRKSLSSKMFVFSFVMPPFSPLSSLTTIIMCCWTWSRCKRKKNIFVQKSIFYEEICKKKKLSKQIIKHAVIFMNNNVGTNKILFIEINVFTVILHVKIYGWDWVSNIKVSYDLICPSWLLLHRNTQAWELKPN